MIRPKKHLGQHFLKDDNIARKIVDSLSKTGYKKVLEIGAGTGVLTKYLIEDSSIDLSVVEIDPEAAKYLRHEFSGLKNKIFEEDFLEMDFDSFSKSEEPVGIIGNFPYNISTQILFRVYELRNRVPEVVGMFQKEVAQRIASTPSNKNYGILSVLMQAFYDIEYLFTVNENVFSPPPKVKSGVIRLKRNDTVKLRCNEELFKALVKAGFNQRRKTLRNSLNEILKNRGIANFKDREIFRKRAEELSVNDFVQLSLWVEGETSIKSSKNE